MDTKAEILVKIKELKAQLPPSWADVVAVKMGKSKDSVFRYARGENVQRNGYHIEVLRILIQLVEKENERIRKMLDQQP
jgi:hypothetical protein